MARAKKDAATGRTLSELERRFVVEYLVDLNGTQAAIRAGYAPTSAHVRASRLLKRPAIQTAITEAYVLKGELALKAAADQALVTGQNGVVVVDGSPAAILNEATILARSDIGDAFDDDGKLLPLKKWPEHFRRAVSSIKVKMVNLAAGDGEVDTVVEVKLWDKPKAIQLMAQHHKLLSETIEHHHDFQVVFDWGPEGPPPEAQALEAAYRVMPSTPPVRQLPEPKDPPDPRDPLAKIPPARRRRNKKR